MTYLTSSISSSSITVYHHRLLRLCLSYCSSHDVCFFLSRHQSSSVRSIVVQDTPFALSFAGFASLPPVTCALISPEAELSWCRRTVRFSTQIPPQLFSILFLPQSSPPPTTLAPIFVSNTHLTFRSLSHHHHHHHFPLITHMISCT